MKEEHNPDMKGKKIGGGGRRRGGRSSQGKGGEEVKDGGTLDAACTWLSVIFATGGPSDLLVPLGRGSSVHVHAHTHTRKIPV